MSLDEKKDKRIKELVKKMSSKDISLKESVENNLGNQDLEEQSNRFKKLASYDKSADFSTNSSIINEIGQTVNTMTGINNIAYNNKYGFSDNNMISANVTAKESLEISIKRTLDSGAPINNIGFYDEVNWNLEKMGYDSKSPIDIKKAINDIMKYGEIRNS